MLYLYIRLAAIYIFIFAVVFQKKKMTEVAVGRATGFSDFFIFTPTVKMKATNGFRMQWGSFCFSIILALGFKTSHIQRCLVLAVFEW